MARKRRPGGRTYRRPDFNAEVARHKANPEYQRYAREEQDKAYGSYSENIGRELPVHSDPVAPAHPHVTGPTRPPRASRLRPRYLVAGAAGAGAVGGAGYLIHRSRRRNTVKKGLIDPLTGASFIVEKRYIEDDLAESTGGVLVAKGAVINGLERAGQSIDRHPGRWAAGLGAYTAGAGAVAHHQGKKRARSGKPISVGGQYAGGLFYTAGYKSGQKELARKRDDESAAFHLGRSSGGRTKVSSVRVPGLPIQSASFSRGNPEARPGTRSHANKLTHVRHHQKQHPRGTLLVVRHGGRDKSGSSVGKSTQFGQSSAVGRRIVSAY